MTEQEENLDRLQVPNGFNEETQYEEEFYNTRKDQTKIKKDRFIQFSNLKQKKIIIPAAAIGLTLCVIGIYSLRSTPQQQPILDQTVVSNGHAPKPFSLSSQGIKEKSPDAAIGSAPVPANSDLAQKTPAPEIHVQNQDAKLELALGKEVDQIKDELGKIREEIEAKEKNIEEKYALNTGKADGRIDELQHRIDTLEKAALPEPVNNKKNDKIEPVAITKPAIAPARPVARQRGTKRPNYHVTAAGGSIALIAIPGASQESMKRVTIGSTIDGWGEVKKITETGPNHWSVITQNGTIN